MKKLIATAAASLVLPAILLANVGSVVDNGDGTFTYTQQIDATSSAPYYTKPANSGFGVYGFYDKDYGWQHNFKDYNISGMTILSAKLSIEAYDVDSEAFHGTNGEYDVIKVDNIDLNPGLLQGTNGSTDVTTFDVPIGNITDDGLINTYMDIDTFHTSNYWATKLNYSKLVINYKIVVDNNPPVLTLPLACTPSTLVTINDDLVVNAAATDPDAGDTVTFNYRWFVDVGQNLFTDDEIGMGVDHVGNTVTSADLTIGHQWRVEVTPVDSNGALGQSATCTWQPVSNDTDGDGVDDDTDAYPNDPKRAFNSYYPAEGVYNTLMFEDVWPAKGDYDLNDVVTDFNYHFVTDAQNKLKEINYTGDLIATGAALHNGFAIAIPDLSADDVNVTASSLTVNGTTVTGFIEAGHNNNLVFVIAEDLKDIMISSTHSLYNTESGDSNPLLPIEMKIVFNDSQTLDLGEAPFNPFIFYNANGLRTETHLINHAPTELHTNNAAFGTSADASDPANGKYYVTENGLPWAVEVNDKKGHAFEQIDFAEAYPKIIDWALSGGTTDQDWPEYPVTSKLWNP
jgi:LruC domain-containing protein